MIQPRILARVSREDFVGRDAELRRIVGQASRFTEARRLVLRAAPGAGGSELLRQSYDHLFALRRDCVPFHFAFHCHNEISTETARRFFQTFLRQFVAYRRVDPKLADAPITPNELLELALPSDYEVVANLIETYEKQSDDRDLLSFCFGLPHRLAAQGRAIYPLIEITKALPHTEAAATVGKLAEILEHFAGPIALTGLRRNAFGLLDVDDGFRDVTDVIHLERMTDDNVHRLVDVLARGYRIETNEATRDLIVQQMNSGTFFIERFVRAAHDTKTPLDGFLACQRLYVDELAGGAIKRCFDDLINLVAPSSQTRRALLRVLYESAVGGSSKSSLWSWKKRLGTAAGDFERIIDILHVCELINSTGTSVEINSASLVWMDYLRAHYRLEVAMEPRAKVVATMLLETLKRAPQTMARKYRREAALDVCELAAQFNCQDVPASLFHYDQFDAKYRGEDLETINAGLDGETNLMRLPQIVQVAPGAGYSKTIDWDIEQCTIAHGFEGADYTDENEVVWLIAEIDSKLEAEKELVEQWCDRLSGLARELQFERFQIWLIAPTGFSERANELLTERRAFGSSRQQFELLSARVKPQAGEDKLVNAAEYEMVIPMDADSELVSAHAVEQIARRVNFRPEAINQIKTALVEASINAAEHSLSPDRKIYQRFRVEDDKLVVTVASRGVVPAQVSGQNGRDVDAEPNGKSRRGWGLKLIKTLMDEVEFERVDDGTRLRMTKYIRK